MPIQLLWMYLRHHKGPERPQNNIAFLDCAKKRSRKIKIRYLVLIAICVSISNGFFS